MYVYAIQNGYADWELRPQKPVCKISLFTLNHFSFKAPPPPWLRHPPEPQKL